MDTFDSKQFTTPEKWRFFGHLLFSIGTMCLSISTLLKLAQDGDLPESGPTTSKTTTTAVTGRDPAYDFFRRS